MFLVTKVHDIDWYVINRSSNLAFLYTFLEENKDERSTRNTVGSAFTISIISIGQCIHSTYVVIDMK